MPLQHQFLLPSVRRARALALPVQALPLGKLPQSGIMHPAPWHLGNTFVATTTRIISRIFSENRRSG
jgi:hypothetical protein